MKRKHAHMPSQTAGRRIRRWTLLAAWMALSCSVPAGAQGQDYLVYNGDPIPAGIEEMYTRGLDYLVRTQTDAGSWSVQYGSEPGVVGLAILAMLAHGDDPNFGPYGPAVKRAVDLVIRSANPGTGYIGTTMYNHGFALLALAKAYGAVNNDRIGPALERGVRFTVACQSKNPAGAWRYAPDSRDADTTVSGSQMVALFAARNAGIGVPDEAIRKGVAFFVQCQTGDGGVGYTGPGSPNAPRTAIGALVFALARQKDGTPFKGAMRYLEQLGLQADGRLHYYLYYAAQAYFHGNMESWQAWNAAVVKRLVNSQNADGSWTGENGPLFSTAAALLLTAVNYRLLPIYER